MTPDHTDLERRIKELEARLDYLDVHDLQWRKALDERLAGLAGRAAEMAQLGRAKVDVGRRWLEAGELLDWPKNLTADDVGDLLYGLIHFAQVFRPPAPEITAYYEHWMPEVCVEWTWGGWSAHAFVDAHAYRFRWDANGWNGWYCSRSLGYSPGALDRHQERRPEPKGGFSIDALPEGGTLHVEAACLGFGSLSRSPVSKASVRVPKPEDVLSQNRRVTLYRALPASN